MRELLTTPESGLVLSERKRLLKELFKRRTWQECFVSGISVIKPSVEVLLDYETHRPIRRFTLGGFEFELRFPQVQSLHWIGIQHWDVDRYWLTASSNPVDRPLARYTRFSRTFHFENLEPEFHRLIETMLKGSGGHAEVRSNNVGGHL